MYSKLLFRFLFTDYFGKNAVVFRSGCNIRSTRSMEYILIDGNFNLLLHGAQNDPDIQLVSLFISKWLFNAVEEQYLVRYNLIF